MNIAINKEFESLDQFMLLDVNGGAWSVGKGLLLAGAALLTTATIIVAAPAVVAGVAAGSLAAAAWTGGATLAYGVGSGMIIGGITAAVTGHY